MKKYQLLTSYKFQNQHSKKSNILKLFYLTSTVLAVSFIQIGLAQAQAQAQAQSQINNGSISKNPIGVPMSSLDNLNGGNSLPLSNQPMNMNSNLVNQTINKTANEAEERLSALNMSDNSENSTDKSNTTLPLVDTSSYNSELQSMAETQRQIDLLNLKQKQADAAAKLWTTLFNAQAESGATNSGGNNLTSMASVGKESKIIDNNPKIFSIGCTPKCSASIVVPNFGVQNNVHVGDLLGNGSKVVTMTYNSVVVTDKNGNTSPLQLISSASSGTTTGVQANQGVSNTVPSNPLGMVTPNTPGGEPPSKITLQSN